MRGKSIFDRISSNPLYPNLLSTLGGLIYLVQSWYYAHTQSSVLDEGAYLLKGYLFANGTYWPFQDYGPWTNHMPLSFLIPGWVEKIFGPGLRTGRYFAIVLGVMMLLGVWLVSRRFGNPWFSSIAIWLLALNVPILKVYSVMTSQVLVACLLAWVLVLTIGPGRKAWQVYLGMLLAGVLFFTRINLVPVLPLLLVYVFWEHGKKIGIWSFICLALVVVMGHAIFWPGIMKLWAYWLPGNLFPFLEPWGKPVGAVPKWDPQIDLQGRLLSFFTGLRIHFFAVMSVIVSLVIWPAKQGWRATWRFKVAVFLTVAYVFLFGLHAWAALGNNYCVFCFQNYLMFFYIIGILLAILIFSSLNVYQPRTGVWFSAVIITSVTSGIVFSLIHGRQLDYFWGGRILINLLTHFWHMKVPQILLGSIASGEVELWALVSNKFGWQEDQLIAFSLFLSILLLIWLVLWIGRLVFKKYWQERGKSAFNPGFHWLAIFVFVGTLFTFRAGHMPTEYDCGWDVIASYEAGGNDLAQKIPPGAKIFWRGGLSAAPLLYLSDYEIYPPQINDGYTFQLQGESDALLRYGWWNDALSQKWLQEADFILVEGRWVNKDVDIYDEIMPTPPLLSCRPHTEIHIFIQE